MGSVHAYETSAGRRYRVLYRKPDHSQGQKRGFKTKRDADLFLAEVEVSKAKGDYVDPADARVTVATLGADWLATQGHLKPSSYRPVEMAWRVHVESVWGGRSVGSIRHSEVAAWVGQLTAGKGATTVLRAYGVLAAILDVAVKDRRVSRNVARGVPLPRKKRKPRVYLTHEQVDQLAEASEEYATLVRVLAYTGLRWGEVTGLRIRHVDALRRRLTVAENAVAIGAVVHVGTPKSHEERSVPYPAFLSEPIAKLCEGRGRDELLFAGEHDGHLRRPNTSENQTSWFLRALTETGLPRMTLHDLRHTAASLAISSGANVKAVQRMLGHASAAMTLDTYADLFDDDLDAVSQALDDARARAVVAKVLPRASDQGGRVVELPRKSGAEAP